MVSSSISYKTPTIFDLSKSKPSHFLASSFKEIESFKGTEVILAPLVVVPIFLAY